MAQAYGPVEKFNYALDRAKMTPNEFVELTKIGPSAVYEWNRPRSRQAPEWAIVLAQALAQLREAGLVFSSRQEATSAEAEAFLTATPVKGTFEGHTVWRFPELGNFMFDELFIPEVIKNHPVWAKMSIGQRAAYMNMSSVPELEVFYEQTRTKMDLEL